MRFETVELEDLGKVEGAIPVTLHYHEDKEVFLKIVDESPDSKEADWDEVWDDHSELIDTDISDLDRFAGTVVITKNQFKKMASKYIITKK